MGTGRRNDGVLVTGCHWISGNMGASEWLLTGTAPDGVRIKVRGCDHWEFCGGKVVRKDSYWKIVDKSLGC